MSCEKFKDVRFKPASLRMLEICAGIIKIYQCITRNIIPNTERSYKNLAKLVSEGRLAGMLDWGAIEDRIRQPWSPSEFASLKSLAEAALRSYRLPRWEGQDNYVELWVEKDALAGVLRPLASRFHATMCVNRGYSSQSAMYEAAGRFNSWQDKERVLLYLGDHDPSGEDMVRDIRDRMHMFGVENLEVRKLALTREQITQYNPPPNPAKQSDPRADAYRAEHGDSSWEVDALPPEVLSQIITDVFEELIDREKMDAVVAREERDKKELSAAVAKIVKKSR